MSEAVFFDANTGPLAARLLLAQDPATPPRQLQELGEGPNSRAIKEAVARNPNAPPTLLLKLAGRYWQPFLENPVLPLLLLEDPGLPHRLPLRVLRALVRREGVSPLILQTLARHKDREVREGAKFHIDAATAPAADETADWQATLRRELEKLPAQRATLPELLDLDIVPAWLLEAVAGTSNSALRGALLTSSKRPDATPELRAVGSLLRRAYGERRTEPYVSKYGSYDQTWIEGRAPLSEAEVRRLATGSLAWQLRVAQQRGLPAEVLAQLARSPYPRVRRLVAGHPQLTPGLALTLAGGPDTAIRQRLAANRRTPEALLTSLARSPDADLRRRVARNPATSPAALATLVTDADPAVRRAAARHRRTPATALAPLANDPSAEVREALAHNAQCPLAVLEQLGADADKDVRQAVAKSPRLPQALHAALLVDPSSRVRHTVAIHPRTPHHLMEFAHEHGGNPPHERPPLPAWDLSLPWQEFRRQRSRARQQKAAARAAKNLPPRVVPPADEARITRVHRGEYTSDELTEWAASPTAALRAALCYHLEDLDMLRRLADDRVAKVRAGAAHNPRMPSDVLARLALDPHSRVRQNVGSNANTPPAVLTVLAQDRMLAVRDSVAYNKATPAAVLGSIAARPWFGPKMRQRLLHNENTPPELLAAWYVGATQKTRRALAGNPSTPVELLRELAAGASQEMEIALTHNPATPTEVLAAIWARLGPQPRDYRDNRRNWIAEHRNASDQVLAEAINDPDTSVSNYAVKNPRLTPELFQRLLPTIKQVQTKKYFLYGSDCPAFVRDLLLAEGDKEVVRTIAAMKDTPVPVLLELARRPAPSRYEETIAYTLAHNKAAPLEVLETLLETRRELDETGDAPWWYRYLAANPNATTAFLDKLLARLLAYPKGRRRRAMEPAAVEDNTAFNLVSNPVFAARHLHHFAEHPNREVRYALLQRPDCPPELKPTMRAAALRRNLENGSSVLGRASAAADAATSADWLAWLLPKAGWVERLAMVENPNLPDDLLLLLAQDAHRLVRAAAQERQATGKVPDLMGGDNRLSS